MFGSFRLVYSLKNMSGLSPCLVCHVIKSLVNSSQRQHLFARLVYHLAKEVYYKSYKKS